MKRKDQMITKSVGQPLSDNPEEAKRRLSNIRPREVSLVDSAANGRSFLVVKRRGDMKKKDKSLFKGEGEENQETKKSTDEQPPAAAASESEAQEAGTENPAAEENAGQQAVEKGAFTKIVEETLAGIPVIKTLAMQQKDMFMAMSDALMSVAMTCDMIRMDLMSFNSSDGKTGFMGEEVMKSLKTEHPEASESELVEKAGRKMKKDRLMKLKQVMSTLETLVKELDDETEVKKGGLQVNKKTETTEQVTAKSAEGSSETPATETPAAAPAAATGLSAEQVEQIVTKAVSAATEPLKKEIESLKNAPAEPAGEGANETEEVDVKKNKKDESLFKGLIR